MTDPLYLATLAVALVAFGALVGALAGTAYDRKLRARRRRARLEQQRAELSFDKVPVDVVVLDWRGWDAPAPALELVRGSGKAGA